MCQLKEPLTYPEQLQRLKEVHNLAIKDEAAALQILENVNYYRLSAYGIGLKQRDDKEKYLDGISLEHIYRLYEFDSIFRNVLFHVIEQLEIQLRTQISYYLGLKYGAECYIRPEIFMGTKRRDGESVHTALIKSFRRECSQQKHAPLVRHHEEKYRGHFPVWVALELFTFGNLSSLYSIMVLEDRKEIAKRYSTEPKYLGGWILSLVEVRNICAHSGRLYNMLLKQTPHLYPEYKKYRSSTGNRIFPVLLTVRRMLQSDKRWCNFATQLENLMLQYSDVIRLSYMGFPKDWQTLLNGSPS